MQRITPFLSFDTQAEEAVNFYTSIFENSKILEVSRYGDNMPLPKGTVMMISFLLDGQEFFALNGLPQFKFSPSISFVVNCKTQEEIDKYWEALSDGGEQIQCGWLKDKFGISWQITPHNIGILLSAKTPEKSQRVMEAVMKMKKLDMKKMEEAYNGE